MSQLKIISLSLTVQTVRNNGVIADVRSLCTFGKYFFYVFQFSGCFTNVYANLRHNFFLFSAVPLMESCRVDGTSPDRTITDLNDLPPGRERIPILADCTSCNYSRSQIVRGRLNVPIAL